MPRFKTPLLLAALWLLGSCSPASLSVEQSDNGAILSVNGKARYILLPIEDDAPGAKFEILAGDSVLQKFYIRLSRTRTDYTLPFETALYPLADRYRITGLDTSAVCWRQIELSDRFTPRDEEFRPLYHHTPLYGWMNDPNGMFYKDGLWHLYYQYNPYGSRHGNIHWGHSVSRDLVHWEFLPTALAPDSLGTIASGSCIVDGNNDAGFGKDAVIAFFTSWGRKQQQSMAYSTDRGMTFVKYEGNPVLSSPNRDFRDPKVIRHDRTGKWIMILAVGHHMEFYSSADLKEWTFESSFGEGYGGHGGVWECPDMVELPLDGDDSRSKWVLICNINPGGPAGGSATQYFTGEFDGHTFTCDTPPHLTRWADFGKDNYAGVTWHNAPDDRKVFIGWMSNWNYCGSVPTGVFRSANTIARELSLYRHDGLCYLAMNPVPEISAVRKAAAADTVFDIDGSACVEIAVPKECTAYEIELSATPSPRTEAFGFSLVSERGETFDFRYDMASSTLTADRSGCGICDFSSSFRMPSKVIYPLKPADAHEDVIMAPERQIAVPSPENGTLSLRILVDRASVECFEADGRFVMTNTVFPLSPLGLLRMYSENGECRVNSLKIYPLDV